MNRSTKKQHATRQQTETPPRPARPITTAHAPQNLCQARKGATEGRAAPAATQGRKPQRRGGKATNHPEERAQRASATTNRAPRPHPRSAAGTRRGARARSAKARPTARRWRGAPYRAKRGLPKTQRSNFGHINYSPYSYSNQPHNAKNQSKTRAARVSTYNNSQRKNHCQSR